VESLEITEKTPKTQKTRKVPKKKLVKRNSSKGRVPEPKKSEEVEINLDKAVEEVMTNKNTRMSLGIRVSVDATNSGYKFMEEMRLRSIAQKHSIPAAHVILGWCLHMNCAVLNSSWEISTIRNNQAIFKISLNQAELDEIASLDKNMRYFTYDSFKTHKDYPFKGETPKVEDVETTLKSNGRRSVFVQKQASPKPNNAVAAAPPRWK